MPATLPVAEHRSLLLAASVSYLDFPPAKLAGAMPYLRRFDRRVSVMALCKFLIALGIEEE